MKKYKCIFMPPGEFYISLNDEYSYIYSELQRIILYLNTRYKNDVLIKYKGIDHYNRFKFKFPNDFQISYGNFSVFCDKNTVIIGDLGSATLEALSLNLDYYILKINQSQYDPEVTSNASIYKKMLHAFYVAEDVGSLCNHLDNRLILRSGLTVEDLVWSHSESLPKIIDSIFEK